MVRPTDERKQDTILGLSQEINEYLREFRDLLDNRFERSVKASSGKSDKPVIPNVLDEILEELQVAKGELAAIMSFISSDVLPKIN